jgi:hypothetical protein
MRELLNIPYSKYYTDERVVDLFIPDEVKSDKCIFFIHGGGFHAGKKDAWHPLARWFCERGFVSCSMEYRLAPGDTAGSGSNMMKIHKESLKEKVPIVYKKIKTVSRSNLHNDFQTSRYRKVTHANLFQIEPFPSRDQIISERNINTVMKLFNNPYAALTDVEQEQAAKLIEKGYLQKKGTGLFLTMPVIEYKIKKEMESIFERVTVDMSKKYVQSVTKLGDRILLPHIREDLFEEYFNFILSISFSSINRVFYYGMYEGKTPAIPEDYNRSATGICLYYTE